jgi:hypothetical protein
MNRNINDIKVLDRLIYIPEFLFFSRPIHNAVETEIICENGNLGFDCQVTLKNGGSMLYNNITEIHWGIDGKAQFTLESNFVQEQQVFPFRSVVRLEIMRSLEMHPLINLKLNS